MDTLSYTIELVLWEAAWMAVLLGLLFRIGERMQNRYARWRHHRSCARDPQATATAALVVMLVVAGTAVLSAPASAGQGFWWGATVDPGFDRKTVIQVSGTATQVNIAPRGGPAVLTLQTANEQFTVMLGPGWYLADQQADIRNGDPLIVEGSKMMDRRGHLHLVAARVTNQRTGAVLQLRDEAGRALWMGKPTWKR